MIKTQTNQVICFFVFILFFSCLEKNKNQTANHIVKVVEAKGYLVPEDSLGPPERLIVDERKLKKTRVGKAKVQTFISNVNVAGIPKITLAGKPRVCTPGKDTFLLPKKVLAKGITLVAGTPEIVIATNAYSKDHNPQNFSTFKKLQGLISSNITCLLEDKYGNIWFSTFGGGVSKYDGKYFTQFTTKQGLCHDVVVSILEDRFGSFWFGTYGGGVSKYDGRFFTNFTKKEGLNSNIILTMLEDKLGNIWFGTDNEGVSKYDGNRIEAIEKGDKLAELHQLDLKKVNGKFEKSFTHFNEKEGLSDHEVYCMLEDKYGNLWFGTGNGGVSKYDGVSFTNYTEAEGIGDDGVLSMLEDKNGNLWFGTFDEGVSKFDGKYFSHFTTKEGLSHNEIFSMFEDKSGNIWFGTQGGGVSKYDGKSFTHYTEKEGLSNNDIWSILEDKCGNIWLGTYGGGLSRFNGNSFTHFTENDGLSDSDVSGILEDKSGNLWFATNDGGVTKYDRKKFTHFTEKDGLCNNSVRCVLEDKTGNLWFGTKGGGVSKYDGTHFTTFTDEDGLGKNTIFSMIEDKSGNIWFGTFGGGVSKYDGKSFTTLTTKEGLSHNDVLSLLEDRSGNIWIGTDGGGVTKYDGKKFTHFTKKEGLSGNEVHCILEDRSGTLWFSTFDEGVCIYDGKYFTQITEKEGLIGSDIMSMLEDDSGNIWFGGGMGIGKISPSKLKELRNKIRSNTLQTSHVFFNNFKYEDGFLGLGCNRNSILQTKDGAIWIGADDRLSVYQAKGALRTQVAPLLQLVGIKLFNEEVVWTQLLQTSDSLRFAKDTVLLLGNGVKVEDFNFDSLSQWYGLPLHLSLAYTNNYLTFKFIGITMSQPAQVKYQFKLEGLDENWSALSSNNEAPYGNLPHGDYTFKIKAMNAEGVWSNEFHYPFSIRPPWWKTWWFRILAGFIIVGAVWLYILWRERALISEKIQLEQTVNERTKEVMDEKLIVEEQKQLIEEKHKEITDSINYAERIQRALLANKKVLDDNLDEYFILFKPKDVVSGDFYWAKTLSNGNFVLVTADSTGHGVPGAIMSILNMACLDKAITKGLKSPEEILNETRRLIIDSLKNDGSIEGGKDGMDASLLCFDFKSKILSSASAYNPIWVVRHSELIEIEADRMPVGKHMMDNIPFSLQTFALQKGDMVYSLTDGYPDQFGGLRSKKFMYKKLKELLLKVALSSLSEQKEILETEFSIWKGNLEQVDDVCIIGLRVL